MKSFYKVIASIMLCGALMALPAGAQGRGNRNGGRPSTSASRPSSSASHSSSNNFGSRPSNSNNDGRRPSVNNRPAQSQGSVNRPSNSGNRPSATTPSRPNNSFTDGGVATRPGSGSVNNNNGFTRPGGNNGSANRPDNGHPEYGHGGTRPGNSFGPTRPGGGAQANCPGGNPVNRPQPGVRPRPNTPPPAHRPMPVRPWSRPVPPPSWVPGPRVPTFNTLLGLSFGYGFNASINFLLNNNYTVYAYGNNAVYLNNVNMLNLMWPDATLYFSNGGLQYGDFIYATDCYDTMRYNIAYSSIVSAYGSPVSTSYPNNGMSTCWYGRNGRFVTLTYAPMRGADGVFRYYTTLSFGM